MNDLTQSKNDQGIPFLVDESLARGRYVNGVRIEVLKEEFVLDMVAQTSGEAILVGRFYMSPSHAVRLHDLLGRQIEKHHSKYIALEEPVTTVKKKPVANKISSKKSKATKKKNSASKKSSRRPSMKARKK